VITTALMQVFFEQGGPRALLEKMFIVKRWYIEYRNAIVHFFLGALLSLKHCFLLQELVAPGVILVHGIPGGSSGCQ
jgi:hypothetical protein